MAYPPQVCQGWLHATPLVEARVNQQPVSGTQMHEDALTESWSE